MGVILTVEHLRRHFSAEPVLVDVSFTLRAGDKIGLVGPNGCGKTTLLNILAHREETEKGTIEKASDITIGYLAICCLTITIKGHGNSLRQY